MNKKGFICSLVLSVLVTLSLGIYTLVSLFYVPSSSTQEKPYEPTNQLVKVAFRNGENVSCLDNFSEEDETLTFVLEEGQENPLAFDEESGKYVTKNMRGFVKAIVTINEKGDKITYEINVYPHSDAGLTEDAPFIIASEEHLWEFASIMNDTSSEMRTEAKGNLLKYAELVSDIYLTYSGERKNWIPMGNLGKFVEYLTFKGNGHTVYNMKINVDVDNYTDFLTSIGDETNSTGSFNLGFFGCIYQSKIYDLNFAGAVINVSSEVYQKTVVDHEWSVNGKFDVINIGVVAARASGGCLIEGSENKSSVAAKIEGFSYVASGTHSESGIGGVVGYMYHGHVKNYGVDIEVVNNISSTVYSNIGGIAGRIQANVGDSALITMEYAKNTIDNCKVKMNVTAVYNNNAKIGGIAALVKNTDIINSTVEVFKVVDNTDYVNIDQSIEDSKLTMASGVVVLIESAELKDKVNSDNQLDAEKFAELKESFYSNVTNVTVKNFDISMRGGVATGVAKQIGNSNADAKIIKFTNVSTSGSAYAREAFGFAKQIFANAVVSYDKDFEGKAVNASLTGVVTAGFGGYVYGTVTGYADENGNKTELEIDITGLGYLSEEQVTDYAKRKSAYNNFHSAGLVSYLYTNGNEEKANISNFKLNAKLANGLSMAGVVFDNISGAIADLDVNATITSYNNNKSGNNYSTTYMVGGVACVAGAGSSIENVNLVLNVNKDVDKNLKYGVSFFGGLVARIQEDGVTVKNNTVSGDVYFNYSYYRVGFEDTYYNVFLAGGLVGSFSAYGDTNYDSLKAVSAAETKLENNVIKTLNIVADLTFLDENNKDMSDMSVVKARALGIFIGNYYSSDDLDVSTNSFEAVNVTANSDAFTINYTQSEITTLSIKTLGCNLEDGEYKYYYSYGITLKDGAENEIVVPSGKITGDKEVSAEKLEKATFTELEVETVEA